MQDVLNSDIYYLTARRRNYLILRLDSFLSDGAASYDAKVLTIEHVLPQTVEGGSEWEKNWPDKEARQHWVHKLANLVPLTSSAIRRQETSISPKRKPRILAAVKAFHLT
ncbi:HNH endonuclease family protein [Halopseudomonas pachastrellae]|nr:HNH endonuclease family protein [Halopseudomonas pachastrellae]